MRKLETGAPKVLYPTKNGGKQVDVHLASASFSSIIVTLSGNSSGKE